MLTVDSTGQSHLVTVDSTGQSHLVTVYISGEFTPIFLTILSNIDYVNNHNYHNK